MYTPRQEYQQTQRQKNADLFLRLFLLSWKMPKRSMFQLLLKIALGYHCKQPTFIGMIKVTIFAGIFSFWFWWIHQSDKDLFKVDQLDIFFVGPWISSVQKYWMHVSFYMSILILYFIFIQCMAFCTTSVKLAQSLTCNAFCSH